MDERGDVLIVRLTRSEWLCRRVFDFQRILRPCGRLHRSCGTWPADYGDRLSASDAVTVQRPIGGKLRETAGATSCRKLGGHSDHALDVRPWDRPANHLHLL